MPSHAELLLDSVPPFDSTKLGIANPGRVYANLSSAALIERAVTDREGVLTDLGGLSAFTGSRTGRSPKDKFTVRDSLVADQIDWSANQAMDPVVFNRLRDRVLNHLSGRDLYRLRRSCLCRSALPFADSSRDREGVAQPLRALSVPPADARTASLVRSRVDRSARLRLSRRPGP